MGHEGVAGHGDPEFVQEFTPREHLVHALRQARDEIAALKEEVDKLCALPSSYGVYLAAHDDDTVDVLSQGRKVRVRLHPALKAEALRPGQELVLNEALNVVATAGYEIQGDDVPVVIFFDEMDALFRTRGSGISSDVEHTVVPQFLTEVDSVEGLRNVVVIGASNRPDLIDPAILRPGRLDVKIKIDRPDRAAAGNIFHKYLTRDLPIAAEELRENGDIQTAIEAMIVSALDAMYSRDDENRFLEVTYANGEKDVLFFKDFVSGAMIESVVRRAKKLALKRYIGGAGKGLTTADLLDAVREEFRENEDLPNTTNPDDWAKIAGKKGERIGYVKSLVGQASQPQRSVEKVVNTGQYL